MQPIRKPVASSTSNRSVRLPLIPVRRKIWDAARDLVATGDAREVSAVLANRFRLPEAVIDAVLVHEGIRHERVATTLRIGVTNALTIARDVDSDEAAA